MFQLNDEQKKQAAQVLLDSTKPGAVVYCRIRLPANSPWGIATKPVWILHEFEYKVQFPDEHQSCDGCFFEHTSNVYNHVGSCYDCYSRWGFGRRLHKNWTKPGPKYYRSCVGCKYQGAHTDGWRAPAGLDPCFQCYPFAVSHAIRTNWTTPPAQADSNGSPVVIQPKPAPEPEPAPKYRPWATIDEVPISIRLRHKTGKEWGLINGAKMDMKSNGLLVTVGASWVEAWALLTYWDWDIRPGTTKPCGVLLDKRGNDTP